MNSPKEETTSINRHANLYTNFKDLGMKGIFSESASADSGCDGLWDCSYGPRHLKGSKSQVFRDKLERIRKDQIQSEAKIRARDRRIQATQTSREVLAITSQRNFDPLKLAHLLKERRVARLTQTKSVSDFSHLQSKHAKD